MDEAELARFEAELLAILWASADAAEARARLAEAECPALRAFAAEIDPAMLATAVTLTHRWAQPSRDGAPPERGGPSTE